MINLKTFNFMKTSHTNHRNPIGFKVTDNKLMVVEENQPELELEAITPHDEAIIKIATFIHTRMQRRANMFMHASPFFDIEGDEIIPMLNKVYIRYYEKF